MTRTFRGWVAAACLAMLAALLLAGSARAADWGLEPGSFHVDLSTTQAGGHPDVRTAFRFASMPGDFGGSPTDVPIENVRDIKVELPPGLIGNPQAYPTCKPVEFPVCPADTQVGTVTLSLVLYGDVQTPVYNMEPAQGTIAQFGFSALIIPIHLTASLRPDDHGLTLDIPQTPTVIPLLGVDMTFWGAPGSPAHDMERTALCYLGGCQSTTDPFNPFPATGVKSGVGPRPFMNNGAQCGVGGAAKFTMNTWTHVDELRTFGTDMPALTGCEKQKFTPAVSVRPGSSEAGAPTGLGVDIDIPQTTDAGANATPPLKRAVVQLPEGMTLSPSAADGLVGCSDAQVALDDDGPAACPRASEIGTASIKTPLLADDMTGRIYLGTPTPDQLVRLFLVVEGGNVRLKMAGKIDTTDTGRVTATFDDLPQLAASKISLNFTGGPRAVLTNPITCGAQTASVALTPWSSDEATAQSAPITVDQACDKGAAFTPSVTAGTVSSLAGASSPFTLTVTKPDGQPNIGSLDVALPPGLLARLSDVPLCPDAQAAAGTCGAESQIGHTTVSVGPGANPVTLPQAGKAPTSVSLGGPYKGAPFSLSIVVPAQAGPYDLGTVVVRAALFVDAAHAQATIKSDPLPQILKGFPLQYRTINVTIDRGGFMLNPTSCAPTNVGTTVTSVGGQPVPVLTRYQVGECATTPLAPKLTLGLNGSRAEFKDGGHPALVAGLTQQRGESGLRRVKVQLPASMALDPDNAQALCKPEQAAARACPEASIVGQATVHTPALHQALTGPVYFVEATRKTATGRVVKTLPNLWLKLAGEGVPLDLWASSNADSQGRLVTTFDNIPDAPIADFQLKLDGGKHGILVGTEDICAARDDSVATFTGQTGRVVGLKSLMALNGCSLSVAKTTTSSRSVTLRLAGLGAGKVKVSGSQVATVTRTIVSAHGASLTARLTATARKTLARKGRLTVKLTATFTPKGTNKAQRVTKTVTIKAKKK